MTMASNLTQAVGGGAIETATDEGAAAVVQVLLCTFLIVSMQLGFAMLEVGSVREAHRMTVLVKNIMDSVVSCLIFEIHCQLNPTGIVLDHNGVVQPYLKLFQWSFVATSVTICSGSMAERTHMTPYLCYAMVMSGLIYPVVASSVWSTGGFLHSEFSAKFHDGYRYHDYAGAGVVHLTGGVAALAGNMILGRRIMRPPSSHRPSEFSPRLSPQSDGDWEAAPSLTLPTHASAHREEDDAQEARLRLVSEACWPRRFDEPDEDKREFSANGYLQVMGMFQLWVGWYGFNAGSAFARGGAHSTFAASLAAWNTTLSACAAGLGAFLHLYAFHRNLDVGFLCNGVLAGLVSITGACDVATDLGAGLIGLTAGLVVYPTVSWLLRVLRLDDPVDAIAVHAGCGLFGVLSTALFHPHCDVRLGVEASHSQTPNGVLLAEVARFCSPEFSVSRQLLAQTWGAFTIIWWVMSLSLLLWLSFALSECVIAQEVKHLVKAHRHLMGRYLGGSPEAKLEKDLQVWQSISLNSRTARGLFRRYGWNGSAFHQGDPAGGCGPADVDKLLSELEEAIADKVQTALETQGRLLRGVECVAQQTAKIRLFREIAFLRLRIAPYAELSGLGAAASEGGQIRSAMHGVYDLVSELRADQSASLPLKQQVDRLSKHVRSQDAMLHRLAQRGSSRLPSWRRRGKLESVLEAKNGLSSPQEDHEAQSSSSAAEGLGFGLRPPHYGLPPTSPQAPGTPVSAIPKLGPESGGGLGMDDGSTPATDPEVVPRLPTPRERPERPTINFGNLRGPPFRGNSGADTGSTVSNRSAGLDSAHTAGDDTPPPMIYGRAVGRSARTDPPRAGAAGDPQINAVAAQLVGLLQAHQGLVSALQSGAVPGQDSPEFHSQLLLAMQRQTMSLAGSGQNSMPGSSRSRGSASGRSGFGDLEMGSHFEQMSESTPGGSMTPQSGTHSMRQSRE